MNENSDKDEKNNLIISGEVSNIPICTLFRYTEEEILTRKIYLNLDDLTPVSEAEKILLEGIDLNQYGYVDPDTQEIRQLTIDKLTTPSKIRLPNELLLKILENAADNLAGGDEAIYKAGKRAAELIPELRKLIVYMKVLPPQFFLQQVKRFAGNLSTRSVELNLPQKGTMHINLYYPKEMTKYKGCVTSSARCAGFRGSVDAVLSIMELENVKITETHCVAYGAEHCEFDVSWDPPGVFNRLKNILMFTMFREIYDSFHETETAKEHEIFVITANLRAEQKKLKSALRALDTANKKLELLSTTDGLTEVRNRGFFDKEMPRLCRIMSRNMNNYLSLLLVDIDYFKSVNDIYGHQAGDETLSKVAALIRTFARRPEDFVARYGGEEFTVVLPYTNFENAQAIAESIRKEIGDSFDCRPEHNHQITVSIGVCTRQPHKTDFDGFIKELIAEADKNLYQAKQNGRNRVVASSCSTPLNSESIS